MASKILLSISILCIAAGSQASRDLAGLALGKAARPADSPVPSCAPLDATASRGYVSKKGSEKAADVFQGLAQALACQLAPLTEAAIAGNAVATSTLRVLYDLWRQAFKPEQWRDPLPGDSNGSKRFGTWLTNLQTILSVNNSTLPYKASLNAFADMSWDEFKATVLMKQARPTQSDYPGSGARRLLAPPKPVATSFPATVDWVAAGKVTPVGFQGQCGAGWAFAAVAALESKILINTPTATTADIDLSEQQMLDCVVPVRGSVLQYANCSAGFPADVFAWQAINGTVTEHLYPYTGKNNTGCKSSMVEGLLKQRPSELVGSQGSLPAYVRARQGKTGFMQAVAVQPLAVHMGAEPTFQFYSSGIYNGGTLENILKINRQLTYSACTTQIAHVVLVAGYDTTAPTPYWLAKNSFGGSWGEGGMARISMIDGTMGTCGMYQFGYYPTTEATIPAPAKANSKGVAKGKS